MNVDRSIVNGIGTITFSHEKANCLPSAALKQLMESVSELGKNSEVRAIVLTSAGENNFSAGASFEELRTLRSEKAGHEFFSGFTELILAIRDCPKLVIARVQGKAVGGGVGLVAACDYALAHESAHVRLSELTVGLAPLVIGPVLQRKIGLSAYGALAIDTGWRDARWGLGVGLYQSIHSTQYELNIGVAELVDKLSKVDEAATQALKRALWSGTENWNALLTERAKQAGKLAINIVW